MRPIRYSLFDSSFLDIYPHPPLTISIPKSNEAKQMRTFYHHLCVFVCFCYCFSVLCLFVILFCSIPPCLCPTQTLLSRAMHICFCTTLLYGQTLSSQPLFKYFVEHYVPRDINYGSRAQITLLYCVLNLLNML